ncbi:MAG: hypothetical protein ACLU9S_07680 [Oscillospiraceae bacterium]
MAKKNAGRAEDKYTYFHLISAAIGKAFVLRPKMNRFIAYNHGSTGGGTSPWPAWS